jgi:hypothetical protein
MKPMSLTSPESIAREYNGNKKAIADAARMGLIDPTAAVMAGMFIDRMRKAAVEEQKTDTTVAQDVLGPPPAPQGIQQPMPQAAPQAQPQQPMPEMAQGIPAAQMAATQPQMAPGVEGLPTGEVGNYAGGGIVAFAGGGDMDITDEEARKLGYSSAKEYKEYKKIYGDAPIETVGVPVEDMEITRVAPEFGRRSSIKELDYGRFSPEERNQRLIDEYMLDQGVGRSTLYDQLLRHRNQQGLSNPEFYTSTPFNKPRGTIPRKEASKGEERPTLQDIRNQRLDLSTPFDKPRGVTTREDAARMEAKQAVQDALGLRSLTRGDLHAPLRQDLSTPFNRTVPELSVKERPIRSDLPPSVAANATRSLTPSAESGSKPKLDAYKLEMPDPAANLALAQKQAKDLVKVPTEESQADAIAATKNLYREMGVDPDIYKRHMAKLEEERTSLKKDKEEAKWTRLIEAGLGVMAGKSQFAAVNIGEGASPALKGFAQDIKDVKKAERDLTRAQMALETTENQFKVDQSKSVQSRMEKNQERVDKAQNTLATTTATLANSLNALSGTKYEAQLRDLTSRAVAEKQFEGTKYSSDQQLLGTKYHADKSYLGALAHAGATQYSADRDTRSIERIMKEKNVDYTTALGIFYDQRQRDPDRYNSLRTALNKADADFQNTPFAMKKSAERSKLDPVKDKAKIEAINADLAREREKFRNERGITPESIRYLQQEDTRLSGQFGGGAGQPGGVGGFVVNTPQGPVSFTTKEQADAFKRQYNLP